MMIATGFAGVVTGGGVDVASGTLLAAVLVYRAAHAIWPSLPILPRRVGTLMAFAILFFYPTDIFWLSLDFVEPTVRLLCLFSALQLLMARAGRDYFYLGLLGFLHLLSASMYTAGMGFLGLLLLFQVMATSTYAAYEVLHGARDDAKSVETASGGRTVRYLPLLGVVVGCGILLLSAGLFAILPRAHGAGGYSLRGDFSVGFSQQVDLGLTGALNADPRPVMRIESLDGSSMHGLHWRGVTLHRFDGVRWTGARGQEVRTLRPRQGGYTMRRLQRRDGEGRSVRYRVSLDDLPTDAIFIAGEPERISGAFPLMLLSPAGALRVPDRPPRGLRYEATSWLVDRSRVQPTDVIELFSRQFRRDYLQMPEYDPRIAELAAEITAGATSTLERAQMIESYFQQNYDYTLDLPEERQDDPLAHFLFERKEGHCEYFASAMGLMLRTIGVPSRLVGGFAGGVANPLTGAHVVRSSDAHAWVDAYVPGYGWLEFDPSPMRPAEAIGPLTQLWMYWDALQAGWMEWVVGYDATRQAEVAVGVQERSRAAVLTAAVGWEQVILSVEKWWNEVRSPELSFQGISESLASLGPILSLLLAAALVLLSRPWWMKVLRRIRLQRGAGNTDDARYFFRRAVRAIEKRGTRCDPQDTGENIAERLEEPAVQQSFRAVLRCYNAARFGANRQAESRLPQLVRELETIDS